MLMTINKTICWTKNIFINKLKINLVLIFNKNVTINYSNFMIEIDICEFSRHFINMKIIGKLQL